jgi:hypothetical protein
MEVRSSRRVRTRPKWPVRGLSGNEIARALISMMARSTYTLHAKAGYIDARPHQPGRGNLLHRTAGPYIGVKSGKHQNEHMFSGLAAKYHLNSFIYT